jgi:hypothetical protein
MTVQVITRSIGGIAHYSCPRGQYMLGNSTRICLKKGTWSGMMPVCKCGYKVLRSQVLKPKNDLYGVPYTLECSKYSMLKTA